MLGSLRLTQLLGKSKREHLSGALGFKLGWGNRELIENIAHTSGAYFSEERRLTGAEALFSRADLLLDFVVQRRKQECDRYAVDNLKGQCSSKRRQGAAMLVMRHHGRVTLPY